jgi:hypothetical protein
MNQKKSIVKTGESKFTVVYEGTSNLEVRASIRDKEL